MPEPETPVVPSEEKPKQNPPSVTPEIAQTAKDTILETGTPADQIKPEALRKCKYTYGVYIQQNMYAEVFVISFVESDPKMAVSKAIQVLKENVSNAGNYVMRIKSIEVLE